MAILVDTREQKPLWKGKDIIRRKLHEGDYSTEELEHHVVVERKSPGDLYGSILQGHERFRKEIVRSIMKGKDFYIFVECSKEDFICKRWDGAYQRRGTPAQLASIVKAIEEVYDVNFVWCDGRVEMKHRMKAFFISYKETFLDL